MDKTGKLLILLLAMFLLFAVASIYVVQASPLSCHMGWYGPHCHLNGIDHGHFTS